MINQLISLKLTDLFLCTFFRICPIIFLSGTTENTLKTWIEKVIRFQIAKVQPQGVAYLLLIFCYFQSGVAYKSVFSLVLLIKVLLIKKACNSSENHKLILFRTGFQRVNSKPV